MKIGLSLSGGAARGLVHLGVLQELEKARIPVDMVAGCSIGALIGAMYSVDPDVDKLSDKLFTFLDNHGGQIIPIDHIVDDENTERRSIFKKIADALKVSVYYGVALTKISYLSSEGLKNSIGKLVPDIDIKDCKLPFSCSATDIKSYKEYYFTEGSLLDAVVASCSLPGLYPPVDFEGMQLIDGGWSSPNHIDQLRAMGAGFVIASDIQHEINQGDVTSGLDVVIRSNTATRKILSRTQLKTADIAVQPDTCDINWWDFESAGECLVLGQNQTRDMAKKIKRKIRIKKLKNLFSS